MNTYLLYTEPQKTFSAIFAAMKQAKKSITFETFDIGNDAVGEQLIRIAAQKSKTIPVEGIVDSYQHYPNEFIEQTIHNSRIKLHVFHPIRENIVSIRFKKMIEWLHIRTHRKVTIIDETIAFVGGTNYNAKELGWRDIMVKITGPIVKDLVKSFKESKGIATKHLYAPRKINKKLTKTFTNKDVMLRTMPLSTHKSIFSTILKLIKQAKKEIIIVTPYFVADTGIGVALRAAIKRGVHISILIPKKGDHYSADIYTKFNAFVATKQGMSVFEYPRMVHAKYMIVDDVVMFGSANFNNRSLHYDYELNIATKDKKLHKQLRNLALADISISKQFKTATWKNRSWKQRIMQGILRPIRKYF